MSRERRDPKMTARLDAVEQAAQEEALSAQLQDSEMRWALMRAGAAMRRGARLVEEVTAALSGRR